MQGYYDPLDGRFKVKIQVSGTTPNFSKEITALFDTGHNGTLSLPILDLIEIGAKFKGAGPVTYANGYGGALYYFEVTVSIDGSSKPIVAAMIENPDAREAIAGVQLFSPYITFVDFNKKSIWFTTEEELKKLAADSNPPTQ